MFEFGDPKIRSKVCFSTFTFVICAHEANDIHAQIMCVNFETSASTKLGVSQRRMTLFGICNFVHASFSYIVCTKFTDEKHLKSISFLVIYEFEASHKTMFLSAV